MRNRICIHCDDVFDTLSPAKKKIGGRINECPDCIIYLGTQDATTKYLGVSAGDGKMSGLTILKFESNEDRDAYSKMWRNNSGQNKGKACQLGRHLSSTSGLKFKTVQKTESVNHKGKND